MHELRVIPGGKSRTPRSIVFFIDDLSEAECLEYQSLLEVYKELSPPTQETVKTYALFHRQREQVEGGAK